MQFRAGQDFASMRRALKVIGQPDALGAVPIELTYLAFCDEQGRLGYGQTWSRATTPILIAAPQDITAALAELGGQGARIAGVQGLPDDEDAIVDFRDDMIGFLIMCGDRMNWEPTPRLWKRATARLEADGILAEGGPVNGLPWVVAMLPLEDRALAMIATFFAEGYRR